MYISLNWIKDFVDLDGIDVNNLVNKFTLSCAEVEGTIVKGQDVSGVITARIEGIENHPDSKKLHLLKVNNGKEVLDVVCGAPNVRVGLVTAFATIGAQVGEVKISKATVAGYESNGMCCSAKELGISDDHSGIIEFPDDTKLGVDIKSILPIDDVLIEVDNKSLTNRPDMWGHYGIAREIAAITGRKLKEYQVDNEDYSNNTKLDVTIESDSCNRYSALRIGNVSKTISPMVMQIRLFYCGMRAISLLADLTNYIMLELGQPMHSFDGSKVKSITVRNVDNDTKFTTLDGVERILPKDTMVIDIDNEIGAVAGIMGGLSSEIENTTKETFIESANFDAVKVRKSATALGLRSEASARYEKSLDPEMTVTALRRYVYLLKNIDGGINVTSELKDVYKNKYPHIDVAIDKQFIDRYAGIDIPMERVVSILSSLQFDVSRDGDALEIGVPSWRATKDISCKADIVEEITRVYGYDNIVATPILQPTKISRLSRNISIEYDTKYALADKYNMHEIHSYIWEDAKANANLGIETKSYIRLVNSLQKDNDDIRSSMKPTIIRAIQQNKKYASEFGLFEVGHVVTGMKDNLAIDEKALCIGIQVEKNNLTSGLLKIKNCLQYLFDYIICSNMKLIEGDCTDNYLCPVNYYNMVCDDKVIGDVGVVSPSVQHLIDESKYTIVAEINMNRVNELPYNQTVFEQVSKYPTTSLDFNFVLGMNELYGKIENVASTIPTDLTYKCKLLDIFNNVNDNTKSYTIRYFVTSMDHTLSSGEIESFHKSVIDTFEGAGIHLKTE